MSEMTA